MKTSGVIDNFRNTIAHGEQSYEPIRIEKFRRDVSLEGNWRVDATFDVVWREHRIRCLAEVKGRSTPRLVRTAASQIRDVAEATEEEWCPVIIVPHLTDGVVEELRRADVSGIDLNGNYLMLCDELLAIRLDRPNEYPESRPIKKIYSRRSSLVGRFLLSEPRIFEQVGEIHQGIRERNGEVSLATVSKVLNRLDEELLIEKRRGAIRLLQPRKLLDRLRDGYRAPEFVDTVKVKLPDEAEGELLGELFGEHWMWSGETSAEKYTVTTPPTVGVVYTRSPLPHNQLEEFEDSRF